MLKLQPILHPGFQLPGVSDAAELQLHVFWKDLAMRFVQVLSARFPSSPDIRLAFAACALIVYNWLVIQYLYRLPGWLYYQGPWDLAGILGYGLVFAGIESVSLLLVPLALAIILPGRLLRDKFAVGATSWVVVSGIWAAAAHYTSDWLRESSATALLLAFVCYVMSVIATCLVVYRYQGLQLRVRSFLERAGLLLYFLYLPATLLGLVLIAVRNIG